MFRPDRQPSVPAYSQPQPSPEGHAADDTAFQQRLHQARVALHQLAAPSVPSAQAGGEDGSKGLLVRLERRIHLMARLCDLLFGLNGRSPSMAEHLQKLGDCVIDLDGDGHQIVMLRHEIEEGCPPPLADTVQRLAHELLAAAVRTGLRLRMIGQIELGLTVGADRVVLSVRDNGWSCEAARGSDPGLVIAAALAQAVGGEMEVAIVAGWTTVRVTLPVPPTRALQ